MGPARKREVIDLVRRSPLSKRQTLAELGLAGSTYYRWQRRFREQGDVGLVNRRPQPGTVWNRLRPEEEQAILAAALREPDRSPREVAFWLCDHAGFAVSESSVYRVLKRHGLIREVKRLGFPAGPEYRVKTRRPNEQWQSDASYFFVMGWGWYYLVSVLDDYSRMILAWDLKTDMTAESNPPPVGSVVKLLLDLPRGEVRARAVVRHAKRGKGMGIKFVRIGQEGRARLKQLMAELLYNYSETLLAHR
jgi:transposase